MKILSHKLKSEMVWTYARTGAFQRASIYAELAGEDEKEKYRSFIKSFLYEHLFLRNKSKKVTEIFLFKIIDKLIIESRGKNCLEGKRLQYGNAQKFINLYLKGMWVIGWNKTPPHFPVDSIVIRELGLNYTWTNMGKKAYVAVIKKAKQKIKEEKKYKSVAEWEAVFYQEKYIDKRN